MTQTKDTKGGRRERSSSRPPELIGYAVRQGAEGKSASWSRIGAAWAHRDGKGYELRMDALPVDGRLTLRFRDEAAEQDLVERDQRRGAPPPELG